MRIPRSRSRLVLLGLSGALAVASACTAGQSDIFVGTGGGESGATTTSATSTVAGPGSGGAPATSTAAQFMTGNGSTGAGVTCDAAPDEDKDQDGWSITQGDCNDCDKNVNPGALEVKITEPDMNGNVPTPADEDCNGMIDDVVEPNCDDNIPLDAQPGSEGAKAIELCKLSTGPKDWGLIDANYVRANGAAALPSQAYGILDKFGSQVNPRKNKRMLGLSSGHARTPGQPGACNSQTCCDAACGGSLCTFPPACAGTPPPGYPQDPPSCPISNSINDDIGLQVEVRAPSNANGFAFDFKFYSFEFPEWVCMDYNDEFIALVSPSPPGSLNGNISFDAAHNPVSVNFGNLSTCDGCAGTGFDTWDDAAATAWLQTTSPVKGLQDVTIRFAIWDTGDDAWDSTVLIDNFRWIADGGTVVVGTTPPPQ